MLITGQPNGKRSREEALGSIVYSYKHGFSGFAAMLTDSQAKKLAGKFLGLLSEGKRSFLWKCDGQSFDGFRDDGHPRSEAEPNRSGEHDT